MAATTESRLSLPFVPGAEDTAEIVDLGAEVIVHVPLRPDERIDDVRCEHGVLELLRDGGVVHALPLPSVGTHRLRWLRNEEVVTAVVARSH